MGLSLRTRRLNTRGINKRVQKAWAPRKFMGLGNRATLTTSLAGANNDIFLFAKTPGAGGNAVTFALTAPTPAPVSSVQTIALGAASAGTFTLTLPAAIGGGTTAAIAYNATAATVQAAILATAGVAAGAVTAAGGPLPGTGVAITFVTPGPVTAIVINGGGLTGATPTVTQTTTGVAGGVQALAVSTTGNAIAVAPASSTTGITSTAIDVRDAIRFASTPGAVAARALVHAQTAPANDGTGVVTALAATPLTGAV